MGDVGHGQETQVQWSLRTWNPVDLVAGFRSGIDGEAEMGPPCFVHGMLGR